MVKATKQPPNMQSSVSRSCTTDTIHLKTHRLFLTNASLIPVPIANVHQVWLCILTRAWDRKPMWILWSYWWIITSKMLSVIEVSYHGLYQFEPEIIKAFAMVWVSCIIEHMAAQFFSCAAQRDFRISNTSCMLTHKHSRWDCQANAKREQMLNNNASN